MCRCCNSESNPVGTSGYCLPCWSVIIGDQNARAYSADANAYYGNLQLARLSKANTSLVSYYGRTIERIAVPICKAAREATMRLPGWNKPLSRYLRDIESGKVSAPFKATLAAEQSESPELAAA